LVQVAAVVDPPQLTQFFIGVGEEPDAFAADGMREQDLRGQSRRGDRGVFEQTGSLSQSGRDGHAIVIMPGQAGWQPPAGWQPAPLPDPSEAATLEAQPRSRASLPSRTEILGALASMPSLPAAGPSANVPTPARTSAAESCSPASRRDSR